MSKPYAFINDDMETYFWLKDNSVSGSQARAKFDLLNGHILNEVVLPGQLVIVGDDSTSMCTPEEEQLMLSARDVNEALISGSYAGNRVMTKDYDLLQSIMTYGAIGIGSSTSAWNKHLKGVEETLKNIEVLHRQLKTGRMTRDQFIAQRQVLFSQLDVHLQGAGRYGTSLRKNTTINHMLGISTKSYLHTGEISGYASKIKGVSQAAGALSKGTPIGIFLDVGVGVLEIEEACSTGREEQCTKAKYVEGGKLAGGLSSSAAGGSAGAFIGTALCLAIGLPTGGLGTLGCAVVGGALLGWGGGKLGSLGGEKLGTYIYESSTNE
ncbi:MAG: hypothetical protein JWP80_755 [Pseudomonas sp.]|nr:hypothetical protein [Pseudomonas sp.]